MATSALEEVIDYNTILPVRENILKIMRVASGDLKHIGQMTFKFNEWDNLGCISSSFDKQSDV